METHDSTKKRACMKRNREVETVFLQALNDPKTVEIMCNQDGRVWVEKIGEPIRVIEQYTSLKVQSIIKTVAGFLGKTVNADAPILEGERLLDGSRFAAQLLPVIANGAFTIRKKALQ